MVKGGFQGLDITGVDLTAQSPTLPGAYATCAGADGKPIRVQTADGQVECSVKKVSTNYVLAGITGDGKILSITIGSTDGISVAENVPGESNQTLGSDSTDITSATSSNPFVAPSDGFVRHQVTNGTTLVGDSVVYILKTAGGGFSISKFIKGAGNADASILNSVFVKKGSKLYVLNHSSDSGKISVAFNGYVNVTTV